MQSSFTFDLDGESIRVAGEPISRTLAEFLDQQGFGRERRFHRSDPWLGGSPLLMLDFDTRSKPVLRSVDAGLILLPSAAGRRFWSAEGLLQRAERGEAPPSLDGFRSHPDLTTSRRAQMSVTTAWVEAWHRPDLNAAAHLTDQFDFCLSREVNHAGLRALALPLIATSRRRVTDGWFIPILAESIPPPEEFNYVDQEKRRYYRPASLQDLVKLLAQFPKATVVGGSAGLAWDSRQVRPDWPCLISTEAIGDLRTVFEQKDRWMIGSAASLTSVNEALSEGCPQLAKASRRTATRAIRNRMTLGGCLASARADDEIAPSLMALDATVRTLSMDGEREIPVARFFEGDGRTNLRPGEFISHVIIPQFTGDVLKRRGAAVRICDTYLAAPRRTFAPVGVSAGFAAEMDGKGRITSAFLAYAGVADRPVRTREVEKALVGRAWSEETIVGVLSRLNQEIDASASPASMAAQSALSESERDYRRQLVITLLQKFFYQYPQPGKSAATLGVIGDYLSPPTA